MSFAPVSPLFRLLAPLLLLSLALSAASAQPAQAAVADAAKARQLLAQAEAVLLTDPPGALQLCSEALETLPPDATAAWGGDEISAEELRERVEKLADAYAATAGRFSFATHCLNQLIGPDRVGLALEMARHLARSGQAEAALSLAETEKLVGHARVQVLAAIADFHRRSGAMEPMQKAVDEMVADYNQLSPWERNLVRETLADRLVAAGRLHDLVSVSFEASEWQHRYYLSFATAAFPSWVVANLREQAIAVAQQQEPGERAIALVRFAGLLAATDEMERAESLVEMAREAAESASGREQVIAFAALAEFAADWQSEEQTAAHVASAIRTVLDELDDWQQTDALNELAVTLAGTAAATISGPRIETASALLSATAEGTGTRNKYRIYEFRGLAAASSPAGEYSSQHRIELFAELLRLDAMPGEIPAE